MTTQEIPTTQETPTIQEIQQSISAAFDSVNLINSIIEGTQDSQQSDDNKKSNINRNVQHLKIMLSKDWFVSGSSVEQQTQINECITSGKAYILASRSI